MKISSSGNKLYLRGSGNTFISESSACVFSGTDNLKIDAIGRIDQLLDWETVLAGGEPQMADFCYDNMFYGCTSLVTAPELPATTLADYCYSGMFCNCTSLNLYSTPTGNATYAWTAPSTDYTDIMFYNASLDGETFPNSGNPIEGTTYYWATGTSDEGGGSITKFIVTNGTPITARGKEEIPQYTFVEKCPFYTPASTKSAISITSNDWGFTSTIQQLNSTTILSSQTGKTGYNYVHKMENGSFINNVLDSSGEPIASKFGNLIAISLDNYCCGYIPINDTQFWALTTGTLGTNTLKFTKYTLSEDMAIASTVVSTTGNDSTLYGKWGHSYKVSENISLVYSEFYNSNSKQYLILVGGIQSEAPYIISSTLIASVSADNLKFDYKDGLFAAINNNTIFAYKITENNIEQLDSFNIISNSYSSSSYQEIVVLSSDTVTVTYQVASNSNNLTTFKYDNSTFNKVSDVTLTNILAEGSMYSMCRITDDSVMIFGNCSYNYITNLLSTPEITTGTCSEKYNIQFHSFTENDNLIYCVYYLNSTEYIDCFTIGINLYTSTITNIEAITAEDIGPDKAGVIYSLSL